MREWGQLVAGFMDEAWMRDRIAKQMCFAPNRSSSIEDQRHPMAVDSFARSLVRSDDLFRIFRNKVLELPGTRLGLLGTFTRPTQLAFIRSAALRGWTGVALDTATKKLWHQSGSDKENRETMKSLLLAMMFRTGAASAPAVTLMVTSATNVEVNDAICDLSFQQTADS